MTGWLSECYHRWCCLGGSVLLLPTNWEICKSERGESWTKLLRERRCWLVETLIVMLIVMWVVHEKIPRVLGLDKSIMERLDWWTGRLMRVAFDETCFEKRKSRLITFWSGDTETEWLITFLPITGIDIVADVKAIPGEEVVSQHCVLVMDLLFSKDVKRKNKFRKKCLRWK